MRHRRVGRSGLQVSELSLGSWLTFGDRLDAEATKACVRAAFDAGCNFFDTAEGYADGRAESVLGEALRTYRREDLVVSTKIFQLGSGPNDRGLSRKHLVEGTRASLRRLGLDYVDLLYCHRPDPETPIEETVQALDWIVRSGQALYWGTSEWSAQELESAQRAARDLRCAAPIVEQPRYNLFARRRVEEEYGPLIARHGFGLTTYSPLASGLLSGKYAAGVPAGSRLERVEWLRPTRTDARLAQIEKLGSIARELGCTTAQLAIAWCLLNPNVSSVLTGATSAEQVRENFAAAAVRERLGAPVLAQLEAIVGRGEG